MRTGPMTRLLIWASGHSVAEVDAHGDRLHYKRAGALVLVATGIAFSVGLSFLFYGLEPVRSPVGRAGQVAAEVGVATLIAAAICAMDRWIVSTVYDRDSPWFRLVLLLVRVLVSVPMALLAAFTLTPLLAAGPINQQLASEHDAAAAMLVADPLLAAARDRAQLQVDALSTDVASAQRTYDQALLALSAEESGRGPSGLAGCGTACRASNAAVTQAKTVLLAAQQAKRATTVAQQAAVSGAERAIADDLTRRREVIYADDDIFARHSALRAVAERDPAIGYLALIVELLLITIDLLPALLKALSPRTRLESAQIGERIRYREHQQALTEVSREARAAGVLGAGAVDVELEQLARQTRQQIAAQDRALQLELAAAGRELDRQLGADEREQRRLLAEADRARARDLADLRRRTSDASGDARPEQDARGRQLIALAIVLAAVLGSGTAFALLKDDSSASVAATAPVRAAVPPAAPTARPTPTRAPPAARSRQELPPLVFVLLGDCRTTPTGHLQSTSSHFTPGAPYRVDVIASNGEPVLVGPAGRGTVSADGTIPWTWSCGSGPGATAQTRAIDLSTGRDTGWRRFAT